MLSAVGGCELSTTTHVKTAWKKFKDLQCVLSARHLSFKTHGRVYSSCVRSAMLYASETWPLTKPKPPASAAKRQGNDQTDLQCETARHCHHQVQWATCAAWHWGSGPHSEGEKTPMVWTCGTLQWCSQVSLWQVDGKRGPGRPKMTWKQLTERYCREWKLSVINPHDRHTWRSGVRFKFSPKFTITCLLCLSMNFILSADLSSYLWSDPRNGRDKFLGDMLISWIMNEWSYQI